MVNNFIIYSLELINDLLKNIFYFPLWWYSRGFYELLLEIKTFLKHKQKSLALLIWLKKIFNPMYGQVDYAGLIISFFVRLFQIIIRSAILGLWFLLCLSVAMFWLVLPALAVYEIIFQLAL